jgi:hypothetical protein
MGDQSKRQLSVSGEEGGSAKCGSCTKNISKRAEALQCEYCGLWHHIGCQSVSSEAYKVMKQSCGDLFHWFCTTCNSKAVDVLKVVKKKSKIRMMSWIAG